jgi:all-trans-8'-apo-beta-carotenal 15,15'-oxygenase
MMLDETPAAPEDACSPRWRRAFDNIAHEHGFERIRVEGHIPHDLQGGAIYRNGPGVFSRGGTRIAHMFDGDGVIAATRFTGAGAESAVRFVQTKWRDREEKAQRWVHGGYKQPFHRPIRDVLLGRGKNAANTGVLSYQGRLFALCEAGKPFELDPEHLTTLGEEDFNVNVQTFNAHPKRIGSRRATYSIGLRPGRTHHLDVWELPDVGKPRRLTTFPAGHVGMVHDFALTERHIVLFLPPQRLRLRTMLFGRRGIVDAIEWDSRAGTEIVTIPLDAPNDMRRFRTDSFYMEHVANAYEENGEIVIDFTRFESLASFENLVQPLVHLRVGEPMAMSLSRMRIAASRSTATCEVLLEEACELPHTSSAVRGRRHTVTYLAGQPDQDHPYDAFAATLKIDHARNAIERFSFGPGSISGEPIFVRREGGRSEDDGYLLVLVFDPAQDVSYEAIFDARDLSDGPIGRAYHKQPIPPRFHGAWVRGGIGAD